MQLLDTILAFALTMAALATVVTVINGQKECADA